MLLYLAGSCNAWQHQIHFENKVTLLRELTTALDVEITIWLDIGGGSPFLTGLYAALLQQKQKLSLYTCLLELAQSGISFGLHKGRQQWIIENMCSE